MLRSMWEKKPISALLCLDGPFGFGTDSTHVNVILFNNGFYMHYAPVDKGKSASLLDLNRPFSLTKSKYTIFL